jgi:calcium-dependent protein kinase
MAEEDHNDTAADAGENFYVVGKTGSIDEKYTLGKQLGQPGQFGMAKLVTSKVDGREYAVKIISKARFFHQRRHRSKYIQAFSQEIEILKALDHPNCIKLHEVFEDDVSLYLLMDVCKGGELFERIQSKGSYSEKEAAAVIRQITEAVRYLHEKKIAHCDLKPDNFLFEDNSDASVLKVIDFGMSKHVQRRKYHRQLCGTPYYIAPEVIDGHYNEACDMWSIGVVMFVMLFGFPPFWADPNKYAQLADDMIYKAIRKGFKAVTKAGYGAFFPSDIQCSNSAKDLISKLLKTDVAERYSAEEALDHPWLRGETASDKPIPVSVLNSLKAFNNRNKFKQRILHAMTNTLTDDQIELLKTAFKTLDKNGDGTITANEMRDAFGELSNEEVQQIVSNADIDGDGTISYEELMIAAVQRKIMSKEERLLAVFRSIDKNGDGHITVDELKEALGDDNAAKLIAEVDSNGDGVVDYEEFLIAWGDSLTPEAPKLPNMPSEEL